jgi:putative endonuclease
MQKGGYVYIATNRSKTLYIGVTNNLERRMDEHKREVGSTFAARYNITRLVYYEQFADIRDAIAREKQLKRNGGARRKSGSLSVRTQGGRT